MNKHSIVNLKCPCFLFRYPNLDIPSQTLINVHRASALPLRCGSEDDQSLQSPPGHSRRPSHSAGTVWSQLGTLHLYAGFFTGLLETGFEDKQGEYLNRLLVEH